MDQIKIGKFIASERKTRGLTQLQLAEKLGITDRAVSKWETGRSLPDAAIMPELCGLLGITVNDLLCGEIVTMENYNKKIEKSLLEMVRQKEKADRRLLAMEIIIGCLATLLLLTLVIVASYVAMPAWARILLIVGGFAILIVAVGFCIRIEQVAGYYQCAHCGYRYIPKYSSVLWAMHAGRTRFMKCQKCGKRSWQKKVVGKD